MERGVVSLLRKIQLTYYQQSKKKSWEKTMCLMTIIASEGDFSRVGQLVVPGNCWNGAAYGLQHGEIAERADVRLDCSGQEDSSA